MRITPSLFVLVCSLGVGGCATIVASGPDFVPVDTTPSGARVTLDSVPVGVTPMTAAVPRRSEGRFVFEMPGFKKIIVDRNKQLNGWFLGNILFGGPIGILVDLAAHNQGKYSTTPLHIQMVPGSPDELFEFKEPKPKRADRPDEPIGPGL